MMRFSMIAAVAAVASFVAATVMVKASSAIAQIHGATAAPGQVTVSTVHAEGAQIYECKADVTGRLTWQFREPIATLLLDGKTVGRHFAGPSWEFDDGSAITGKVVASASGATPGDIPWLRVDVTTHRGRGQLSAVATVQRINTKGGATAGACDRSGAFLSVPYAANYVFLRKP
jgi:hypothetical protein